MSDEQIVGRAELKLKGAVDAFGYDFRGKTVLDIGSSTGGFTELALRRGAARVIAIEKGTQQMKAPLRFDPRVELHEKTDIFDVTGGDVFPSLAISTPDVAGGDAFPPFTISTPDVVLADVSFVSLRRILAHVQRIVPQGADYLVMLKPQFEAYPDQLVNGVVKNEKMRREIIKRFEQWLGRNGFRVVKKRDNEVKGKVGGNQERFYWLKSSR